MPNPVSFSFPVVRSTALERLEILVFQTPQLNPSFCLATHI